MLLLEFRLTLATFLSLKTVPNVLGSLSCGDRLGLIYSHPPPPVTVMETVAVSVPPFPSEIVYVAGKVPGNNPEIRSRVPPPLMETDAFAD